MNTSPSSTRRHHILSVLVENKPGVLARVSGLFARRGYNIYSLAVAPTDSRRAWTVRVETDRLTTTREHRPDADAVFAGTAAQLYLGLWNRGSEIEAAGRPDVLPAWRSGQRVHWS